jgi:hypothetical protein
MNTQKQEQIKSGIELYLGGLSLIKSSADAGITYETLRRHLKKSNLVRSNKQNSRKYTLNNDYFQYIDNEHKAYWLGFMYADGFISLNNNQKNVGISLGEKDLLHLDKFKNDIKATYPIKHYQSYGYGVVVDYVRLLMTSEKMFDDLANKGCCENKSLTLVFPTEQQVPKTLTPHFIRGYFDGDGSFAKCRQGYQVKICGTQEFLRELLKQMNFQDQKLYKRHKNNFYCSVGGKQQVIKIGDYLYKDATIFLERKHSRYLDLLNLSPTGHE